MSNALDETEYPDLLVPPFWGLTERLPMLPTRLTPNEELQEHLEPAILYSYMPVITSDDKLIVLDPYDQTQELFTLTFAESMEAVTQRFRPDGDVLALVAVTLGNPPEDTPETLLESALKNLVSAAATEIRRGLTLDSKRGELIGFDLLCVDADTTLEAVDFMGVADRLDMQFEERACSATTSLGLFVHNSSVE